MEEVIQEGGSVGYRRLKFGWPSSHDAFGGPTECVFRTIRACPLDYAIGRPVGRQPEAAVVADQRIAPRWALDVVRTWVTLSSGGIFVLLQPRG